MATFTPPWETDAQPDAKQAEPPRSGPNARDPASYNSRMLARRKGDNLTPKQKLQRQEFVAAYFMCFDQTKSAVLAGFAKRSAAKKGSELMREPYVQELIQQFQAQLREEDMLTRQRVIIGLLREAHFDGCGNSHSARVTAWSKLGNYIGMEQNKTEVTLPAGVSMTVRIGGNPNDAADESPDA